MCGACLVHSVHTCVVTLVDVMDMSDCWPCGGKLTCCVV